MFFLSFCTEGSSNLLPLGGGTDDLLSLLAEGHHRRSGPVALRVLDDLGRAALHHGHAGVSGAEVDADDGSALALGEGKEAGCSATEHSEHFNIMA